ncbi:hypothetical protein G3I20_31615 [Streptomyces sp. SID8111]|uniref:hypothetical protein n=1 Tax=Streptomyces sp. SID8111 TaxID=2706100 RepID=UPI0013C1DCAC|nr:hypothetical protein [Streptomyces sp. SID8111]NEC31023.1 hypothetical protein [Streptomyces sp. SID8111]
MLDRQQRRTRLRLARQRAAPAWVRTRARAGAEQEPGRRFSWVTLGAALGGIAAIGSLGFTGIATYYGARVAADQLEQSREDSERQERTQAKTFSYWTQFDGSRSTFHIQNRSPDPIPVVNVDLYMAAYRKPSSGPDLVLPDGTVLSQEAGRDEGPVQHKAVLRLHASHLAPCVELVYATEELSRFDGASALGGGPDDYELRLQTVIRASFVDREGQRWERTATSLKKTPAATVLDEVDHHLVTLPGGKAKVVAYSLAKPKTRKAAACDAER